MLLKFPEFNIHSTPLLVLVLQGLILVAILLMRYRAKKQISDLFLAILLLTVCYHQTCYTIGFMGWYDTFRNTKINYFLIPVSLGIAPMIYFYVKSLTTSKFSFRRNYWWHFAPFIALITYYLSIYIYDSTLVGFDETQNGYLKINLDERIVQPILLFVSFAQMLLYLAFTFQLYYNYRKKIQEYFSNTFQMELNWIRNFLIAFSLLFIYGYMQSIISSLITELSYTQQWWLNLFMAIVVIYVGLMGYFTDTSKLKKLDFTFTPQPISIPDLPEETKPIPEELISKVSLLMEDERPYLNPDLNLSDLAKLLDLSRSQLSEIINSGFGQNFNDFVNSYRVKSVQKRLEAGEHRQLSLLGIAYECGFNSKATFNRVFKKLTHNSPSDYLRSL